MSDFLSVEHAAEHIGSSVAGLRKLMKTGKGPKFLQFGNQPARFRKSDVDEWLSGQYKTQTPAAAAAKRKPDPEAGKRMANARSAKAKTQTPATAA